MGPQPRRERRRAGSHRTRLPGLCEARIPHGVRHHRLDARRRAPATGWLRARSCQAGPARLWTADADPARLSTEHAAALTRRWPRAEPGCMNPTSPADPPVPHPPGAAAPPGAPRVPLRSPADILAVVPHLLGFHPARSLVVVGAGGPRQRIE